MRGVQEMISLQSDTYDKELFPASMGNIYKPMQLMGNATRADNPKEVRLYSSIATPRRNGFRRTAGAKKLDF